MKITVLAIGKLRGPEAEWCAEYQKRLQGEMTVKELTAPKSRTPVETQKAETELLLNAVPQKSLIVLLDERGKDLSSRELAAKMNAWKEQGRNPSFLIGGADGVTGEVRKRADF